MEVVQRTRETEWRRFGFLASADAKVGRMNVGWIGTILSSIGLSWDILGALYLGVGLLEHPWAVRSRIWPLHPASPNVEQEQGQSALRVSELPLNAAAESGSYARVGLFLLAGGFVFQLIGGFAPQEGATVLVGAVSAAVTFPVTLYFARLRAGQLSARLREAIIFSGVWDSTFDLMGEQRPQAYVEWEETALVHRLRRILQDTSHMGASLTDVTVAPSGTRSTGKVGAIETNTDSAAS